MAKLVAILITISALLLIVAPAQAINGSCYTSGDAPWTAWGSYGGRQAIGVVFDGRVSCSQYNWVAPGAQVWDHTTNQELDDDHYTSYFWEASMSIGPDNTFTNVDAACQNGHTYWVYDYAWVDGRYYQSGPLSRVLYC